MQRNYTRTGRFYSIEEVLSKQITPIATPNLKPWECPKTQKVDFDGDLINMDSHRYWTFKEKGVKCECCGIEGKYFAKEKDNNAKSYHFNLYAINDCGQEVLMTKNRIIPRLLGGKSHVDNYKVLCVKCGNQKGRDSNEQ